MEDTNRKKVTVWLKPDVLERMDGWLGSDNCKSRGEFVEKALRFYMGYLATGDVSEYISRALTATLRGIVDDNENRHRSLMFKWTVELNMLMHVIANHFGGDPISLRQLRGYAVDEVKRTNGQVSFDNALKIQRAPEMDDDPWQD